MVAKLSYDVYSLLYCHMTFYITGTIYPVICCLQNSDDEVIFPLGAKVSTFSFMFTFFFQVPNFFHHDIFYIKVSTLLLYT